ncbi:MAG: lipid-A-disaccharide synthase [Armatimonadetes bacterium]|nr:lipid-A-disaccharide synthase [Armatimonadota bacterium]
MAGLPPLEFFGTGGDCMQEAGVRLLCHLRELAHIGPREALVHLGLYCRTWRSLLREAAERGPAVAVLLDFPDFNLRLARSLSRLGVPVVYYISPQLWAWRRWRIRSVRRYTDRMLVILPFEEDYYRRRGVDAEFVGHPLLEEAGSAEDRIGFLSRAGLSPSRPLVALLPGSRRKEVEHILPAFLEAARIMRRTSDTQFVASVAPSVSVEQVRAIVSRVLGADPLAGEIRLCHEASRDILSHSDFAMVKSGTSTLEAALAATPFLIAYKISWSSWTLGRLLIRTPFKGLVNLIAGEMVVPELLQGGATPEALAATALEYLEHPEKRAAMRARLGAIRDGLGSRRPTEIVAERVSAYLQTVPHAPGAHPRA